MSFLCDLKKLFKDIRIHRLREISHEVYRLQENMLGISRRISGQVNDLQLREFLIQLIGIIDSPPAVPPSPEFLYYIHGRYP